MKSTRYFFPLIPLLLVACTERAPASPEKAGASPPTASAASEPTTLQKQASARPLRNTQTQKREQLISIFGGFEQEPTKEALFRIEPDEPKLRALLLSIYEDREVATLRRHRALGLMRHIPGIVTHQAYERILNSSETTDAERRIALRAYASSAQLKAQPILIELLTHEDSYTRGFAALELGALGTEAAKASLEDRLSVEPEEHVRWRISRALGREVSDDPVPLKQVQGSAGGVR